MNSRLKHFGALTLHLIPSDSLLVISNLIQLKVKYC